MTNCKIFVKRKSGIVQFSYTIALACSVEGRQKNTIAANAFNDHFIIEASKGGKSCEYNSE
jgi:hypothetical protein